MSLFSRVLKFNPYHDKDGKFASRTEARSFDKNFERLSHTIKAIRSKLPQDTLDKIDGYEAAMVGKQTSADLYRLNGQWNDERTKEHQRIMDEFFKDADQYVAKPGEKPQLIVLGGRGGSGKSKLTDGTIEGEDAIDSKKYKLLDPDAIKSQLPGYDGTNAALYHEESSHINDAILQEALARHMNIIQDVTMKSYKGTKESMDWAKAHGYEIEGHFMSLPRIEAGIRAAARSVGKKPRYVPLSIIASNTDNESNFNRYADEGYFKKWSMYSNDVPADSKPKFLKRGP